MKRAIASAALLACAAACSTGIGEPPGAPEPKAMAPLPALGNVAEVRLRFEQRYSLGPDRRFLRAIAEAHALLSRWKRIDVELDRTSAGTRLRYYGQDVGTIADLADFSEQKTILVRWCARVAEERKVRLPDSPAAPVGNDGELPIDEDAIATLRRVQTVYVKLPNRALLHEATRAMVSLAVTTPDELEVADGIAARAFAMLAIDQAVGGTTATREEALIASHLGYAAAAEATARLLPESDGIRAAILGDDARLAINGGFQPAAARILALRRLSSMGAYGEAARVRRQLMSTHAADASVLATRLDGDPHLRLSIARALFARVLLSVTRSAGVPVAEKARADLDGLVAKGDPDPTQISKVILGWLAVSVADATGRIELELPRIGQGDEGPFFDRELRIDRERALLATALRRIALLALDRPGGLEHVEGGKGPEELGASEEPFPRSIRVWYEDVRSARRGLLGSKWAPSTSLGAVADLDVIASVIAWDGRASLLREMRIKLAPIVARMDARPVHRAALVELAATPLRDATIRDRYLRSLSLVAARRFPQLSIARARLDHDDTALRRILLDPLTPGAMQIAMLDEHAGAEPLDDAALKQIDESRPNDVDTIEMHALVLLRRERRSDARALLLAFVTRNGPHPRILELIARTHLAEGDTAAAWARLEPLSKSEHDPSVVAATRLLVALGRKNEAEAMARARAIKLGASGLPLLVDVLFASGEDEAAARELASAGTRLSPAMIREVAGHFVARFGARPKNDALAAFEAMRKAGVPRSTLIELADAMGDRRVAHEMRMRIPSATLRELGLVLAAYRRMQIDPALDREAFLRDRIASHWRPYVATLAFAERADAALMSLVPDPTTGTPLDDHTWLLRAAAHVRSRVGDDRARAWFEYRPASIEVSLGRYLTGAESEESVRAGARDPRAQREVAFFLGLRAEAEARKEDAIAWYQTAADFEGPEGDWAFEALDLLR